MALNLLRCHNNQERELHQSAQIEVLAITSFSHSAFSLRQRRGQTFMGNRWSALGLFGADMRKAASERKSKPDAYGSRHCLTAVRSKSHLGLGEEGQNVREIASHEYLIELPRKL